MWASLVMSTSRASMYPSRSNTARAAATSFARVRSPRGLRGGSRTGAAAAGAVDLRGISREPSRIRREQRVARVRDVAVTGSYAVDVPCPSCYRSALSSARPASRWSALAGRTFAPAVCHAGRHTHRRGNPHDLRQQLRWPLPLRRRRPSRLSDHSDQSRSAIGRLREIPR